MSDTVYEVVEPFVRRGLFPTAKQAVAEMAKEYVIRQIEHYRSIILEMETRHGMTYEQFERYLESRSETLSSQPNPALNEAIMAEEEDALDWKIAREMLQSWLGIQTEVSE